MADLLCTSAVSSQNTADFIVRYRSKAELTELAAGNCLDRVSNDYAVIYTPLETVLPLSISQYTYTSIPKLYSLMDSEEDDPALERSGFYQIRHLPSVGLTGRQTLVGIIDTGINFAETSFRNSDGTSRIAGIWDQTLPPVDSSFDYLYGKSYTNDEINQALTSHAPYSILPSRDENGHGTFLAQLVMAASPDVMLAVVKLKPAKSYLKEFYLIAPSANAYQENDIMTGISYLLKLSARMKMPLTICLGLGTAQGGHEGTAPLSQYLGTVSSYSGVCVVTSSGNETGYRHHYYGTIRDSQPYLDVEIRVDANEKGFTTELWMQEPELYTIGFLSPGGEEISQIPPASQGDQRISFILEPTVITVNYLAAEIGSGNRFIFIRFQDPSPGIWKIRVYNILQIQGHFHLWLPVHNFLMTDTYFLNADPDTTITDPGNAPPVITVGAYDASTGSIWIHSGRGFTRSSRIKPDLTSPGVRLLQTSRTGTSYATAITCSACACLLSWGIVDGREPGMNTAVVKSYLIRGARRNSSFTYPSREWGYGTLDLYGTLLAVRASR